MNGWVWDAVVQSDGKIVICGWFSWYDDGGAGASVRGIARLNADGSLDTSFVTGTGFNWASPYSMGIQSDGKIVIGGDFSEYNGSARNNIVRLHTNGTLDTSFNSGSGFDSQVRSVQILSNDKIYIGGWFTEYNGSSARRVVRLNADGTRDVGFDSTVGFGSDWNNYVYDLAIQSDGKVVAVGNFSSYNGQTTPMAVCINADGSPDNTFSSGDNDYYSEIFTVSVLPSGKMILGGYLNSYDEYASRGFAFINADGSYNPFFTSWAH